MASITPVVPSAGGSGRLPDSGKFSTTRVYSEIMAERERANTAQVVKKKVTPTVPDEPAYIKHITARTPVFAFNEAVLDRPLTDMGKAYITMTPARRKEQASSKLEPNKTR
ncbi:unnamed protein product [Durusdinium trenchii]|uniref:Uncharacterized protein n=1 Tax=Durusdinium trenchii TaxID=1381693 RepID=A0ABP0QYN6_9DINO